MKTMRPLERRMWTMLAEPTPTLEAKFAATSATSPGLHPRLRFSPFVPEHTERAMQVVDELMKAADSVDGAKGLEAALDLAETRRATEGPALVNQALLVFSTHHPKGRFLGRSVPPLAIREPEKLFTGPKESNYRGRRLPEADGLEWFREDPFANEHHEHWHVVYPTAGIPDGNGGRVTKDRQGELFLYMHQQMLARYDAERHAVGLPRVESFSDYTKPIAEGYEPGGAFTSFAARNPDRVWRDLTFPGDPSYTVATHEALRGRLMAAVETSKFDGPAQGRAVDVDALGGTIEPTSPGSASRPFYGNHHGMGHILTASIEDPTGAAPPGVMADPATAIRDPFFYRWHKHVDDFYRRWQDKLPPNDFSDRPNARMRKSYTRASDAARSPDIQIAYMDALPADAQKDLAAYARKTFGGARWNVDDPAALGTTTEIQTWMASQAVVLADRTTKADVEHLVHREMCWFLRIENLAPRHTTVTVRVFLVPKDFASDRWAWIEMDKFLCELAPNEKAVVARRGRESSVVRKPAEMMPRLLFGPRYRIDDEALEQLATSNVAEVLVDALRPLKDEVFDNETAFWSVVEPLIAPLLDPLAPDEQRRIIGLIFDWAFLESEKPVDPFLSDGSVDPQADLDMSYCTCGWPYNLLFPRGTEDGMPFRIAVMLTDWDIDRTGPDSKCGSLSFCGAMDRYPDRRPMLYPFDRQLTSAVTDTIMSQPNMAFTDVTIKHVPAPPT